MLRPGPTLPGVTVEVDAATLRLLGNAAALLSQIIGTGRLRLDAMPDGMRGHATWTAEADGAATIAASAWQLLDQAEAAALDRLLDDQEDDHAE